MSHAAPRGPETEPYLDERESSAAVPGGVTEATASALWRLLLEARRVGSTLADTDSAVLAVDRDGNVIAGALPGAVAEVVFRAGRWQRTHGPAGESLLALYLPLCAAAAGRSLLVAHLGQSLDGYIATASGDSNFVTGAANLDHLHRMRALCDAIVVGAGTVLADDPQLTTRRVPGPSPVRVVIDPDRRLAASHAVFSDGVAPTLVLQSCVSGVNDEIDCIVLPRTEDGIDLAVALRELHARGLNSIFVEGGGKTVSRFLASRLVDRLQVAVAPLITGNGRRGLDLPPQTVLADCLRPASRRFAMGEDVLFDCDLQVQPIPVAADALPRLIS